MAIIKKYRARIVSIKSDISDVYIMDFVSLGKSFQYSSGQFLHLAIDEEYDGIGQWPDSRCFSMQSSPEEDFIRITYAVKGNFTRTMVEKLKIDSEVWLKLPYGNLFQQPHNKEKTVFIAGGTGITPFLSLFKHVSFNQYVNPAIYLGFRSINFNLYEEELNQITNTSKKVTYFYQDKDGSIDIQTILAQNSVGSSFFISGPPAMIKSFKDFLLTNGVPPSNVLTDEWE